MSKEIIFEDGDFAVDGANLYVSADSRNNISINIHEFWEKIFRRYDDELNRSFTGQFILSKKEALELAKTILNRMEKKEEE